MRTRLGSAFWTKTENASAGAPSLDNGLLIWEVARRGTLARVAPSSIGGQRSSSRPERHFTYLASVKPYIQEGLLIPFEVGGAAVGTIWVIVHNESRCFNAEDLRVLTNLSQFAAAAYWPGESLTTEWR